MLKGGEEEKEEKVKGEEKSVDEEEERVRGRCDCACVRVARAHREHQRSDRGVRVRRITWFADLYLGKVSVSSD